jgi:hypothetical protein
MNCSGLTQETHRSGKHARLGHDAAAISGDSGTSPHGLDKMLHDPATKWNPMPSSKKKRLWARSKHRTSHRRMMITSCSPICEHCGATFKRRGKTAICYSTTCREKVNTFRAAERRMSKRPKQTRAPDREGKTDLPRRVSRCWDYPSHDAG